MNFLQKYLSSLWGALLGTIVGLFSLVLILWLVPIPFYQYFEGFAGDPFWGTAFRRALVVTVTGSIYFPLVLALIKLYSFSDKRYRVADKTLPDAIFGGLKETGLLICATWVFIQVLLVCYL